jgi:hypothetical protein
VQHGSGTVGKINETMRTEKYDEESFWEGIFGKGNGIDVLWKDYCASLESEQEDSAKMSPPTEQEGLEKGTSPSEVDATATTDSDLEEDEGAVLVEREHHTTLARGMGGSVRRRPST